MHFSRQDIETLPRIKRINIINSVTGVKPANLIATRSNDGKTNVAIFSSVVHLGSNPALIGFFFRPQHEKPTDSYKNICQTGYYTINQVPMNIMENAHFSSARFPSSVSEFERCNIHEEYLFDFHAPFVEESRLKMGLKLIDQKPIEANNTILMIGQVEHLVFDDEIMDVEGNLNLEPIHGIGIGGVNTYYDLQKIKRYPYAHLEDVPTFEDL